MSVDLAVSSPEAVNLKLEYFVLLGPVRPQLRTAQPCRMVPVGRRGDSQNSANRLNPKAMTVLINKGPRYFKR
ncbi:MAG: hypothetical protein EBZ08_12475, partial [Betaproteobacteria bacterium]|nr:hypothetical protein [Betaproteobacteria bacterium]